MTRTVLRTDGGYDHHPMGMEKTWDTRRIRTLANIALANGVLIFSAFYSDWTLYEVTLGYTGEFVILMLLGWARVISARRIAPGWVPDDSRPWQLATAKLIAILMSLMWHAFACAVTLVLLTNVFMIIPAFSTLKSLALVWSCFLFSHALDFIDTRKVGAYDDLISDGRLMASMWRYPAMFIAAAAVLGERTHGAMIQPWFFILALAVMAFANSAAQVVEMDGIRAAIGSAGRARPP